MKKYKGKLVLGFEREVATNKYFILSRSSKYPKQEISEAEANLRCYFEGLPPLRGFNDV